MTTRSDKVGAGAAFGPDDRPPRSAIVALAASAGGPGALAEVLSTIDDLPAPIMLVQHIDGSFMDDFVSWMARASNLPVRLAEDGAALRPGVVYVAPSDMHCKLGWGHRIGLDAFPHSLHRPSADELFGSLAARAGAAGVGVLLTGMGEDGALGLLELRRRGGHTIAQDEETSAVYGMPAAAARLGAAVEILPLARIANAIRRAVDRIQT
jgi:two-component system chemotaxis response regulator CheB